jgi:hypothetical protein
VVFKTTAIDRSAISPHHPFYSEQYMPHMPRRNELSSGMIARTSPAHRLAVVLLILGSFALGQRHASAQAHDPLLNGAVIGAATGAGAGIAFTHAVRDSDLTFGQYAYGALIFGAIGAGIGVGVDALLNRAPHGTGVTPRRVVIAPTAWRRVAGVAVKWRW